jgi:hypothetical protein
MLRSTVEEVGFHVEHTPTWACPGSGPSEPRWRVIDRALRDIASRRAALDAEEARWLREAEVLQIWRPLGMVSAIDYLERTLGHAPRTAQDRLRVARALGSLPRLTDALARGELSFSAVRELTRVATPATEASWLAAAKDKNLRQIEDLVADHHPGDGPDDPRDPKARTHVVRGSSYRPRPSRCCGRPARRSMTSTTPTCPMMPSSPSCAASSWTARLRPSPPAAPGTRSP